MMTWHKRNISILLFLLCWIVCITESRYRDKERKREKSSSRIYTSNGGSIDSVSGGGASIQASILATPNLCSRERDQKLLCYCLPESITNNLPVTKADCWIFHKDFHSNDTIWNAFYQQKSLRDLKFTVQPTGSLDYIPTKYLEILNNLTILNIEYSQILIVKGYAFANLQHLEVITLTNNQIEIIDQNAFANHILLKELNLQGNQITEIDRYAFRNLPLLSALYLNQNNITNLHEETFKELGKLEDLDLGHNQISVLTGDMFKGLGNLNTLKLTHNSLNFIGDTVFAELWSLQELELDDNQIERISDRALDGLNNLKTLNLRNNRLKKLDNGLLRGTPALLSINLQDNLLETLTYYNFQPIMDNLVNGTSELSVSDNKLICDCRLQWIFDLRNRTKNTNLKNSLESIECILYDGKQHQNHHKSSSSSSSIQNRKQNHAGHSNINGDIDGTTGNEFMMNAIRERTNEQNFGNHLHHHQQQQQHGHSHHRQYSQNNDFNGNKAITDFDTDLFYDDQAIYKVHDEFTGGNNNAADIDINSSSSSSSISNIKTRGILKNKNFGHPSTVVLLQLKPESLPCPDELNDPTELPLSRESIGMNVRTSHSLHLTPQVFNVILFSLSTILFGIYIGNRHRMSS